MDKEKYEVTQLMCKEWADAPFGHPHPKLEEAFIPTSDYKYKRGDTIKIKKQKLSNMYELEIDKKLSEFKAEIVKFVDTVVSSKYKEDENSKKIVEVSLLCNQFLKSAVEILSSLNIKL
jgi:hypothetical protein